MSELPPVLTWTLIALILYCVRHVGRHDRLPSHTWWVGAVTAALAVGSIEYAATLPADSQDLSPLLHHAPPPVFLEPQLRIALDGIRRYGLSWMCKEVSRAHEATTNTLSAGGYSGLGDWQGAEIILEFGASFAVAESRFDAEQAAIWLLREIEFACDKEEEMLKWKWKWKWIWKWKWNLSVLPTPLYLGYSQHTLRNTHFYLTRTLSRLTETRSLVRQLRQHARDDVVGLTAARRHVHAAVQRMGSGSGEGLRAFQHADHFPQTHLEAYRADYLGILFHTASLNALVEHIDVQVLPMQLDQWITQATRLLDLVTGMLANDTATVKYTAPGWATLDDAVSGTKCLQADLNASIPVLGQVPWPNVQRQMCDFWCTTNEADRTSLPRTKRASPLDLLGALFSAPEPPRKAAGRLWHKYWLTAPMKNWFWTMLEQDRQTRADDDAPAHVDADLLAFCPCVGRIVQQTEEERRDMWNEVKAELEEKEEAWTSPTPLQIGAFPGQAAEREFDEEMEDGMWRFEIPQMEAPAK